MANIVVLRSDWYAVGDATFLQSGDAHAWTWDLGNIFEAVSVTAHPVRSTTTEYKVKVEGSKLLGARAEVDWNFGFETSGHIP